jgi:hypothetical protein
VRWRAPPNARSVTELALLLLAQAVATPAPQTGRVTVESDTSCPAGAEVEARLSALLPPLADGATPARAAITADEGALHVRLAGPDGAALGDRTLRLEASCADRANVVAVVIATWEAQQRAEQVPAPSLPRPTAPPAITSPAASTPPAVPAFAFELAAGPAVTLSSDGAAPTGVLAASLWGRRLGARLSLFGAWPLEQPLADGHARWSRGGTTLELGVRARGRAGRLDAHGGVVLGALVARGRGFEIDHTASGFAPGLAAGLDWSYAFGPVFLGAGANGIAWAAQRLVSPAGARELPRLQLALDLHLGFAF